MKKLLIFAIFVSASSQLFSMETSEQYGQEAPVVVIQQIANKTAKGYKLKVKGGIEILIPAFSNRTAAVNIPLKFVTDEDDSRDQGVIKLFSPLDTKLYYEIRFSRKLKRLPTNEYQLAFLAEIVEVKTNHFVSRSTIAKSEDTFENKYAPASERYSVELILDGQDLKQSLIDIAPILKMGGN